MPLNAQQLRYLRGLTHHLHPVVTVAAKGLSENVLAEIDAALRHHELIKVRLYEPEDKAGMSEELATRCDATLCGLVGHTAILYRRHPERPKIVLRR